MANFLRLILCSLLFISSIAEAALPKTPGVPEIRRMYSQPTGTYAEADIACSQEIQANWSGVFSNGWAWIGTTKALIGCKGIHSSGVDFGNMDTWDARQVDKCPLFSTAQGDSCICNEGYREDASINVCKALEQPNDERTLEGFCKQFSDTKKPFKMTGSSSGATPSTACYQPDPPFEGADAGKGCASDLGDSVAVPNADGSRSWSATGVFSGGVCTPGTGAAAPPGEPEKPVKAVENKCPSGFPGSVNGASVCVPSVPDSGIEGVKKTEEKAADGTKRETTEDTKCTGGVCTTTKTVKHFDSNGNSTGSAITTTKESIGTKCAADPGNKVCGAVGLGTGAKGDGEGKASGGTGGGEGGESSFGGTCAAGFKAVSDDAVINAMAEETYRQNCKVNPDDASQTLAKAEAEKTGNRTGDGDNPNNSTASVGSGNFDTSDAFGGGSGCIADKSVSVMGKSFLLPLSTVCPYLEAMGMVLLACSFLLAARIVTRG